MSSVVAVPIASGTADVGAADDSDLRGPVTLFGFSFRETAATPAAASIVIRNGTSATDPIVAVIQLAGDESHRDWFGPQGIRCHKGIYVDRESGSTEGSVWVG